MKTRFAGRVDVERTVRAVISKKLEMPASEITPDSNIVLDLGADSLDLFELITKLEAVFRIDLPLQEEEEQYPGKLGTFKGVVDSIWKEIHA